MENTKRQCIFDISKTNNMKKANYVLAIYNETLNKRAKQIKKTATTTNLEKLLNAVNKLRYAKHQMIIYIFKELKNKYVDVLYTTNHN